MIRSCNDEDFEKIYEIINDSAQAYRGVIPEDRWHNPYMSRDQLTQEIEDGIIFWGDEQGRGLIGVMGIQDKGEVTLIRHAYVLTEARGQGVGTRLMKHLETLTEKPILIGTWAAATWAVSFYQKHGYQPVNPEAKDRLLKQFWNIPGRQVETSVVLADRNWTRMHPDSL